MGLDQTVYAINKEDRKKFLNLASKEYSAILAFEESEDEEFDDIGLKDPRYEVECEEVFYWRKHPNLQGWAENIWRQRYDKGEVHYDTLMDHPGGNFNCTYLELVSEDIDDLEKKVESNSLPETTGFFYGQSGSHHKEMDQEFIQKARELLSADKVLFYRPS